MRGMKRAIAGALCILIVISIAPKEARAAAPLFKPVADIVAQGSGGVQTDQARISFVIVNNDTTNALTINSITVELGNGIKTSTTPSFVGTIPAGGRDDTGFVIVTLSETLEVNTVKNVNFTIKYRLAGDLSDTTTIMSAGVLVTSGVAPSPGNNSGTGTDTTTTDDTTINYPEGLPAILMLAPLDASGQVVPTPAGNYGDRIKVRIPIFNRGGTGARATRILVTPVLTADLNTFPFDIEAVDYTRGLEEMRPGETREVDYELRISKEATTGVKEVKFNAVYYNGQKHAYETATFSVFVNVVKGKTAPLTGAEGEEITTTPKVIIEGYSVKPAKAEDGENIYGGDQFALTMKCRNTASEAVQNIQITLSNETGSILPANNGSNTLYIDRIGAGDMVEKTVQLQTVPEIEAKSHKLSVKFNYESAKTLKSYEVPADISLSVKQRIRIRIDEPIIDPEAMLGNAAYAYFSVYNLGNSAVRNMMVSVEGDGLRLEETQYGGNISSGGQTSFDFGIVAETAGEIQGKIVISYEDAMGEVYKEEKPFTLNVTDPAAGMGGMMIDPETGMPIDPETGMPIDMGGEFGEVPGMNEGGKQGGKMPVWLIVVIAVAVLGGGAAAFIFFRKRRRRKFIEE